MRNDIRDNMIDGKLILDADREANEVLTALWRLFLVSSDKSTSLPYWSDKISNRVLNKILIKYCGDGWIETKVLPNINWGEMKLSESKVLSYISQSELLGLRANNRFYDITPKFSSKPAEFRENKLERPNAQRLGYDTTYTFDTEVMETFRDQIIANVTKGIRKSIDKHQLYIDGSDYKSVSETIIDSLIYNKELLNMGNSEVDSRGRAVSRSMSTIFNPVTYKEARALKVMAPEDVTNSVDYIFEFIAELCGAKCKDIASKVAKGKQRYEDRFTPYIEVDSEGCYPNLDELIWLERIYTNLDTGLVNWTVPIERDATASMMQIIGVLLNDYDMLNQTNVIEPQCLEDVWGSVPDLSRELVKKAATPLFYGSTKSCTSLWESNNLEYTTDDAKAFRNALGKGVFSTANKFKNFIINNAVPSSDMVLDMTTELNPVECNKHRYIGVGKTNYMLYCSKSEALKMVQHTATAKVPDLEQFKRYFVTALIHNLDSQVLDRSLENIDWAIPIYDAVILSPNKCLVLGNSYVNELSYIRDNRTEILNNYFVSIGIDMNSEAVRLQWADIITSTRQLDDSVLFSPTALK